MGMFHGYGTPMRLSSKHLSMPMDQRCSQLWQWLAVPGDL